MPYEVQERIRAVCNERVVPDGRGAMHIEIPKSCTLSLDPALVAKAVRHVHEWPQLELDLNWWLVDLDQRACRQTAWLAQLVASTASWSM